MKRLSQEPHIDPTANIERCRLGRYADVGARTTLIETELGNYSYVANDAEVIYMRKGAATPPSPTIRAGISVGCRNHSVPHTPGSTAANAIPIP